MKSFATLYIVATHLTACASAWGTVGHETVAYIAQNFVTSATASYVEGILSDTSTSYMASVATWADTYRYTAAGAFSAPFHYIDAQDSPPSSCGVSYSRDCGSSGCSVSAINNYTEILLKGKNVNALKFLIHFIGDLHQPLHDENLEVGGNDIAVTWDGADSNLHHIWDTEMITKITGGTTLATAKTWSTTLTTAIKTGTYKSEKSSWLEGIDVSDPITTTISWAKEANAYNCAEVFQKGLSYIEGTDLSGAYYTAAKPVIELQIARAGYRLAAWLNLIATGTTGL